MEYNGWRALAIILDGEDFKIEGIHLWDVDWRRGAPLTVELPHPAYPNQMHYFGIYEIGEAPNIVRFAACELSNLVWGIYLPV